MVGFRDGFIWLIYSTEHVGDLYNRNHIQAPQYLIALISCKLQTTKYTKETNYRSILETVQLINDKLVNEKVMKAHITWEAQIAMRLQIYI